jgi:hypothetical protein
MIRKTSLILTFILVIFLGNINITYASSRIKNDECWSNLNKRILDDIKKSFPELTVLQKNEGRVTQYYWDDLHKTILINGRETTHIKSLLPLFTGSSQGEKQLFIVSGEKALPPKYDNSFVGYMLFKQIDGTNVMIKLRRSDTAWDVVGKRKAAGKRILPTKECLGEAG